MVESRVVPRAAAARSVPAGACGWSVGLLEGGEGPAPAGELAGDRDVGDHRLLLAVVEDLPAVVQPAVALMATRAGGRGCLLPPGPHRRPGFAVVASVVPGGLDQQPAGVGVPGLGDRPLHPRSA